MLTIVEMIVVTWIIHFGYKAEEFEFKRGTGETHDAMKGIVTIPNKHEKVVYELLKAQPNLTRALISKKSVILR